MTTVPSPKRSAAHGKLSDVLLRIMMDILQVRGELARLRARHAWDEWTEEDLALEFRIVRARGTCKNQRGKR